METFSALLAICVGNSPVTGEFPAHRPVALMFSLIYIWINVRANNGEAGDLRRHRAHYDVIVMIMHNASIRHVRIMNLTQCWQNKKGTLINGKTLGFIQDNVWVWSAVIWCISVLYIKIYNTNI